MRTEPVLQYDFAHVASHSSKPYNIINTVYIKVNNKQYYFFKDKYYHRFHVTLK